MGRDRLTQSTPQLAPQSTHHPDQPHVRAASATVLRDLASLIAGLEPWPGDTTSSAHLDWMCRQAIQSSSTWPLDKINRWLGFVQGVLAARGALDVRSERDATRPVFHAAYRADGVEAPQTVEPGSRA